MKITNLKIGTRLGWAFGLLLALMAASTLLGISSLKLLSGGTELIVNDKYPKVVYAYEILGIVHTNARSMRDMLLWNDPAKVENERQNIAESKQRNNDNFSKLEALIKSDEGKAMLRTVVEARARYSVTQKAFMDLAASGKKEDAAAMLLTEVLKEQRNYLDALTALIQHQTTSVVASGEQAKTTYQHTRAMLGGLAAVALILGGGVAFWMTRSIIRPLRAAVDVARTVAGGDLTSAIEVTSSDETGQLLQALKDMNDSLVNIVGQVRMGTDTIATASGQIASGNLDLSTRTEQQASALEETASSMNELTSTVNQNAGHARQANQLAIAASEAAVQGGAVVSRVVETMGSINDAAGKIADIIGVIDGIAFQTNILALNAAVEAARAGEQGRGFAVVAGEVRNLAQRSAAAAREIKALIGDSVEKVEVGTRLVDQAGSTMQAVVASIKNVTGIMAQITAASQEQSSGIEQINHAISQMDDVTQQNAALVEEAAAAAQSLLGQAGSLSQVVGVFKIDATHAAIGTPARTASRPLAAADARRPAKRLNSLKLTPASSAAAGSA